MKVAVSTNTLRAIDDGRTFILNLQYAVANRGVAMGAVAK
jgi:hypothetical protein